MNERVSEWMNSSEWKQDSNTIKLFEWVEGKVLILPMKVSLETDIIYLWTSSFQYTLGIQTILSIDKRLNQIHHGS